MPPAFGKHEIANWPAPQAPAGLGGLQAGEDLLQLVAVLVAGRGGAQRPSAAPSHGPVEELNIALEID